ncbi:MAG: thioredoxin domain-containing protein [Gemmatimonadaceae bacterium]
MTRTPDPSSVNRLADETSPYLLQHADNPVDWYPWAAEALERAKREDKPILLSIGYAACHWCHVMEHESFEDAETARVMNDLFVCIKVDREERPDLDSIYMQAVQAMTGQGGWPMTVFLTPDAAPYFGGTYFPPNEGHGLPSFRRVLQAAAAAYRERRGQVDASVAHMRELYDAQQQSWHSAGTITPRTLELAYRALERSFDERYAGFGAAPKFPPTMALDFLLRQAARTGTGRAYDIVRATFQAMARGGIYDQIGGGFHRYSVDERWLVPHFEKMLYDNALLVRLGAHLWQRSRDAEVRQVVHRTIEWTAREMTSPAGGFYSSLDADSAGHEGLFYTWTPEELRSTLQDETELAAAYWNVTPGGNFEGRSIPHVTNDSNVIAARLSLTSEEVAARIARSRELLLTARAHRPRPGRDDKILASWNGLMLRGVSEAARIFGDPQYRSLAEHNGWFLRRELLRDGRVLRSHKAGVSKGAGFLEDFAAVALGWLDLYTLTGQRGWLDDAHSLGEAALRLFWDDARSVWFDTAIDHETLITRPRDVTDNATPSGNSLATELMLRLAVITGDSRFRDPADRAFKGLAEAAAKHPAAFGHLLGAADAAVYGATEIAVIGPSASSGVADMLRCVARSYLPSLVLLHGEPEAGKGLPLFEGRSGSPDGIAYVCRDYICESPAFTADELAQRLATAAERPGGSPRL